MILKINESNFVNIMPYCSVLGVTQVVQKIIFSWLTKYFKKQKWRTRIKVHCYESERNVRNYVGKCKSKWKKKGKGFYERYKNISAKNNFTPTSHTPALSRISSLNNTTQTVLATQTFDDDQTLPTFWINVARTNMK